MISPTVHFNLNIVFKNHARFPGEIFQLETIR